MSLYTLWEVVCSLRFHKFRLNKHYRCQTVNTIWFFHRYEFWGLLWQHLLALARALSESVGKTNSILLQTKPRTTLQIPDQFHWTSPKNEIHPPRGGALPKLTRMLMWGTHCSHNNFTVWVTSLNMLKVLFFIVHFFRHSRYVNEQVIKRKLGNCKCVRSFSAHSIPTKGSSEI